MEAPYRTLPVEPTSVPPSQRNYPNLDVEGLFPTIAIGLVGLVVLVSAVRHHAAGTIDARAAVALLVISAAGVLDTWISVRETRGR